MMDENHDILPQLVSEQECLETPGIDKSSQQLNRKFLCNVCNYSTNNSSHFIIHKRIHTGERPFACPFCPKKFIEKGKLKQHIHIHTGERPYACEQCNRKFKDRSTLSKHKKTHLLGAKTYRCCMCSETFTHPRQLKEHTKVHRNDTIFICEVCDKHFTQPSALRAHRRIHDSPKIHGNNKPQSPRSKSPRSVEEPNSSPLPMDLHIPNQGWSLPGVMPYGPFVSGEADPRILSIPEITRESRSQLEDECNTTSQNDMISDDTKDPMLTDVKQEPADRELSGDGSSGHEPNLSPPLVFGDAPEQENEAELHLPNSGLHEHHDNPHDLDDGMSYSLESHELLEKIGTNLPRQSNENRSSVMNFTGLLSDNRSAANTSSLLIGPPMRDQFFSQPLMSTCRSMFDGSQTINNPSSTMPFRSSILSPCVARKDESGREKIKAVIRATVKDDQSRNTPISNQAEARQGVPNLNENKSLEDYSNDELLDFMVHRGGFYKCDHCKLYFSNSAMYCLHRGLHGSDMPFKCSICFKDAGDMYQFITHCAH